jgi:hypothetical protein
MIGRQVACPAKSEKVGIPACQQAARDTIKTVFLSPPPERVTAGLHFRIRYGTEMSLKLDPLAFVLSSPNDMKNWGRARSLLWLTILEFGFNRLLEDNDC